MAPAIYARLRRAVALIPRYSLKVLCLAVLLLSCLFGWISYELHCFYQEQEAVGALNADYTVQIYGQVANTPSVEEPYFDLSQLWSGRLYVPMNDIFISGATIEIPSRFFCKSA